MSGDNGFLDRISTRLGQASAWLMVLMVIVTFIVVTMRYVFDAGLIWLQESVVWMHAFAFMIGASYTLQQDGHVRVDVFYREMGIVRRAWVDIFGVLVFLLPLCVFLGWTAFDYVSVSWKLQEASREAGGLPYPLIPMLKTVLLFMPLTLGLQGVALLLRSLQAIREH